MDDNDLDSRNQTAIAEFTLRDKFATGESLTPRNINLFQFNEFNNQVEQFLAGIKRKSELGHIGVNIEEGSYRLATVISIALASSVEADMSLLEKRQDCLDQIDAKRAEVLLVWQAQSKKHADRSYGIRLDLRCSIELNAHTDYKLIQPPLVPVERYIIGTIVDVGGVREPNIHVRPEDDPKTIVTISADAQYLADQTTNLIYRTHLLRIRGRQRIDGGEMQDYQLVEIVHSYKPHFDKAALDAAAEEGHKIWAEVQDAAAWVRSIRGGK